MRQVVIWDMRGVVICVDRGVVIGVVRRLMRVGKRDGERVGGMVRELVRWVRISRMKE